MSEWKVGDSAQWSLGADDNNQPEAVAIGIVGRIEDDKVYVVEVHAFHRLWGGSNSSRGLVTIVPAADLEAINPRWKHIVKEQKNKRKVRNALDELLVPAGMTP